MYTMAECESRGDGTSTAPSASLSILKNSQKDIRRFMQPRDKLLNSKYLVSKSKNYLRKRGKESRWMSREAILKKKQEVATFRMHQYLFSLISRKERRIVDEIQSEMAVELAAVESKNIQAMAATWKSKLSSFFACLVELDKEPAIPDYLRDPVTSKIFKDPVVAQSGITYERASIVKCLDHSSCDPTQAQLHSDVLIPNHLMKELVNEFLQENEWALPSTPTLELQMGHE